jgi:hypothetical protein
MPVLRLNPLPQAALAQLSSHLIFAAEPLLGAPNPIWVNFIEQSIIPLYDSVFPKIPESREIISLAHGAFVIGVRIVSGRHVSKHVVDWNVPVRVQIRVNILCWMSGYLLERGSKIRIGNMIATSRSMPFARSGWSKSHRT